MQFVDADTLAVDVFVCTLLRNNIFFSLFIILQPHCVFLINSNIDFSAYHSGDLSHLTDLCVLLLTNVVNISRVTSQYDTGLACSGRVTVF